MLALVLGAAGFYAHQSAQVVPDFYAQAVRESPPEAGASLPPQIAAQAEQLEHELLDLRQEVRTNELWELRITAGEINAWLATELPRKFPSALPDKISSPRVAFVKDRIFVGFRYADRFAHGVLTLELEPFLAPTPHTLGVRIRRVSLGDLPLPIGNRLTELQIRAAKEGILLSIVYAEGDPVLYAALPLAEWAGRKHREVTLTALDLSTAGLIIQGRISPEAAELNEQPAGTSAQ